MSMLDEIERLMQSSDTSANYRIVNLGGTKTYVEGIKSIIEIKENSLVFQFKKESLSLFGSNLKINYLDKTSCVVAGKISKMELK